ncbi:hypothetical protein ACFVTE_19065 [Arthrobacter sp. NPDC058097]|uniref:hypothetical protein n=1 Tax=Arthrobacter sp. NPDC058097 TaxID=3346340 RepID=UPI0036DE534E
MNIDIKAMLHRVVDQVFDENFTVSEVSSKVDSWLHGVHVSRVDKNRIAIIRASYEWIDAFVPELNVQATLFDYDDVELEKEADLRRVCRVMRAYLEGNGHVEERRRLFRRGTTSVLRIEVDGLEWRLGGNHFVVPYP